ncbi:ANTAR domain-containing response regulator [Streptomyces sp. NPDC055189]
MSREANIARTFVELADTLADDFDVINYVQQLHRRCCEILDVTDAAVLLATPESPASPEARLYDPTAAARGTRDIDRARGAAIDMAMREGPAVDAYRTAAVTSGHLSSAPAAWHHVTFRAGATGYTYAAAAPLRLREETLGSLLLLYKGHDPPPVADLALAQAFADAAAIGLLHARALRQADALNEQLRSALHNRILIEQAKGFLAAHRGISPAEAFETLRRLARHHRVRLVTVAQEVIAIRDLPQTPASARNMGRDTPAT